MPETEIKIKLWYLFYVNKKQFLWLYLFIILILLGLTIYSFYVPIDPATRQTAFGRFYATNAVTIWIVGILYAIIESLFFWNYFYKEQIKIIEAQKDEIQQKNIILEQQKEEILSQKEEIEAQRDIEIKQRLKIEEQNKQITASIMYAQRIQLAILPRKKVIDEIVENFILYLPRDIVSGDFYWFHKISDNKTVIVAADCTGHGVPGAFVSMLGISLLNEIIIHQKITQADAILDELRKNVKISLHQQGATLEQQDGMDISLIILDKSNNTIEFAGANNPIYICRKKTDIQPETNKKIRIQNFDTDKTIIELKPDKMPVGIYAFEKKFNKINYQLQKNDLIYMFSDGFIDQFGGEKNTKFMSKNFKKLLCKISATPTNQQKEILNEKLIQWRGNIEQIDDILVIGLKI